MKRNTYVYRVTNPKNQSTMIFKNRDEAIDSLMNMIKNHIDDEGLKMAGMCNADSDWIEKPTIRTIDRTLEIRDYAGITLERKNDLENEPMFTEYRLEIEKHLLF